MRFFSDDEFAQRLASVRAQMAQRELDCCLIASPENIYYLCGLDHMGYFAYQALLIPREGRPILITRAMERAVVRDQVPGVAHVGYSDGIKEPPPAQDRDRDIFLGTPVKGGQVVGVQPWSMSLGVQTRDFEAPQKVSAPVDATVRAIADAGLGRVRIGMEKASSFLPVRIAEGVQQGLSDAQWVDCSGIVEDCRLVQSERELRCTREAAAVSDAMMRAAIAAAGTGINKREVMAAIYQAMFPTGGTYPGFVPLVRATRTLEHEHGTWLDEMLIKGDILFLEMSGCVRRYHAPLGRLVFIGSPPPPETLEIHDICLEAMDAAAAAVRPGAAAAEVYAAWQGLLDQHGLSQYRRHHCGYAVGIGYPPSWSGSGVPIGLRADSQMPLRAGMVFHLMSWLLRTGRGDSFLSDTIVVTDAGCERLTTVPNALTVR